MASVFASTSPSMAEEQIASWPAGESIVAGGEIYEKVKRAIDIVLSVVFLTLFLPVMLLTAIAIRLTSRGPVVFSQERVGKDGKIFRMYKFRSMRNGAERQRAEVQHLNEADGPVFKIQKDPRLTIIGSFLRRSSIDELPQLVNVLLGQMTLVGPRPMWVCEWENAEGRARLRTKVKPGITCLWQISGRSELRYDQWVDLDLYYMRTRCFWLDVLIVLQTIPAVLSGRGAY